jgi:hypothetical protein
LYEVGIVLASMMNKSKATEVQESSAPGIVEKP